MLLVFILWSVYFFGLQYSRRQYLSFQTDTFVPYADRHLCHTQAYICAIRRQFVLDCLPQSLFCHTGPVDVRSNDGNKSSDSLASNQFGMVTNHMADVHYRRR